MPRNRRTLALAIAICNVAVCSTPDYAYASSRLRPNASGIAADVVALTNHERASHGRGKLRVNPRLMRAAQIQAEQMARARQLAHTLPNASYPRGEDRLAAVKYQWRTYGENVALGQANAADAVKSWMRSRGHRINILNPAFTELGAGYATDRSGRPYFVQVFGSPWS